MPSNCHLLQLNNDNKVIKKFIFKEYAVILTFKDTSEENNNDKK